MRQRDDVQHENLYCRDRPEIDIKENLNISTIIPVHGVDHQADGVIGQYSFQTGF